ncbi:hypothetical protein FEM48_Zijuj05G0160900 [Ziziphus jujuba var. spinosa]|uniref:Protein kinase domain-containing protein n=1 Tax=Ziziphus jujuba var. spinosa TaxID=714518 RepID=A0A978VFS6_ZIZJJ|nr:hypothetical protein FEM48_Zijuj05G0160900 [Ziziphus jujuba var. spinosa]
MAYLHYGAQPGIIHRDIKANNILLDEMFEAKLTETSDVYSFGAVLLELLSWKKALLVGNEDQPSLVTDWAWSLVRDGRALDVIEDDMPDKSPPQVLEKYVLVAILCSHPQLYARPTMDQAMKMLETDMSIPSTPKWQIPLVAKLSDIERSVSTSGSGTVVSPRGYSSYTYESDRSLELKEESRTLGSQVEELS